MRLQAGVANDTAAMLGAALKGGRVPEFLRSEVVELIRALREEVTMDVLKTQLLQKLQADPALKGAAITGAVRRKFVERRYGELLEDKRLTKASELPDETVLILTLSAARLQDHVAFDPGPRNFTAVTRRPRLSNG